MGILERMVIFERDIAIDLGTSSTRLYVKGKGVAMREPTVVAVDKTSGKMLKVGDEAQKMLGRTPANIVAIHPIRNGVISDYETTEKMIKYFLFKVSKNSFFKPRVVICVPSEVTEVEAVPVVAEYADVLQIGARNMQNFRLLKEVGRIDKPVMLKRGLSATLDEWLNAAEYIMSEGNSKVIFCERGIRTYETYTRNTLDLSAVAAIKHLSHLPIVVDPSHGTGKWRMVKPMSIAAVAAGADGLIIEMHPNPAKALSDGPQSLTPESYKDLMQDVLKLSKFMHESGIKPQEI